MGQVVCRKVSRGIESVTLVLIRFQNKELGQIRTGDNAGSEQVVRLSMIVYSKSGVELNKQL